ncbi:hypothetical protein TRFO_18044 [Tritrichomonas foetus]|uniref:Serine/threonine-protein phosphatase n=1 Tax=Tritrichomonas foetus TaxID=1144522 RepID=A0A1J4KRE8_9EUKA|nr:hypothetical protein TRFO_18044 [Tritrichomonas foetus]|eukprot:OHT12238.1 hypothetical protein TRFO_18044 [Tritrichomonas foetus]
MTASSFIINAYSSYMNGGSEFLETLGSEESQIPAFPESTLNQLLDDSLDYFQSNAATLIRIPAPAIIIGDLHGNLHDLLRIWTTIPGDIFNYRLLFLGDYVDRGGFQLETISLLLSLKIEYPDNVFLLRGNHEFPSVNSTGGFKNELLTSGYSEELWNKFNEVFSWLPLAALLNHSIFCVHGGISPHLKEVAQIENALTLPITGFREDISSSDSNDTNIKFCSGSISSDISHSLKSSFYNQVSYSNSIPIIEGSNSSVELSLSNLSCVASSNLSSASINVYINNSNSSYNNNSFVNNCSSNCNDDNNLNNSHSNFNNSISSFNSTGINTFNINNNNNHSFNSSFNNNINNSINNSLSNSCNNNLSLKSLEKVISMKNKDLFNKDSSTGGRTSYELLTDMMWADPTDDCELYMSSNRGTGVYFGFLASHHFCQRNNLSFIIRAHESIKGGVRTCHDSKCVTVFSSSGYSKDNLAGFIEINTSNKRKSYKLSPIKKITRNEAKFYVPVLKQKTGLLSLSNDMSDIPIYTSKVLLLPIKSVNSSTGGKVANKRPSKSFIVKPVVAGRMNAKRLSYALNGLSSPKSEQEPLF